MPGTKATPGRPGPLRISRKEAFGFALARRLLAAFEGTPLDLEMRSVLGKIAESMEGEISVEPEWLSPAVAGSACWPRIASR